MLQDSRGFLWMGTFSGLSRYDGTRVVVYRPVPGDAESLPSSLIFDLHEDSIGTLWVATDGGGLARYSRDSDAFDRFIHDPADPRSPGSDRMFAVADDPYGWIWVGTADAGLDRFDTVLGGFVHYGQAQGLPSQTVRSLLCDGDGVLWVGTTAGLARYNRERDVFEPVESIGKVTIRALMEYGQASLVIGTEGRGGFVLEKSGLSSAPLKLGPDSDTLLIRAICMDLVGRIWVGTDDRGLRIVEPDTGALSIVRAQAGMTGSLGHDAIRSLIVDRSGLVWVGTRGGGAASYNPRARVVTRMGPPEGLPAYEARQLLEARDGTLWVGTDGGGLSRFSADGRLLARYVHSPADRQSLPSDRVMCMVEEPDGSLWVGTDGAGLAQFSPATRRFKRYARVAGRDDTLGGDTVWALLLDSEGTLWVGLEGGGLDRLDRENGGFVHYRPRPGDSESISGNSVRAIIEDSRGRIWLGLWDGGLNLWDKRSTRTLASYKPDRNRDSLADASVTCLFEDTLGRVWVGTGGSGIDRVVEYGGEIHFAHLDTSMGLAGDDIVGALEDERGNVWVVSGRGISRISASGGDLLSWGPADGFQSRFSQNSYLLLSDGRVALGGPDGIDFFRPAELVHPIEPPPVVIADVSIVAHPSADPAENSIRARAFRSAMNRGLIVLKPEDAALSLDFAILDYVDPSRNRLSVSLWGGPAERVELGSQNRAVLGGLAPGEYELRLSGATAGGVWNREGALLRILVKPPFWKTPAFLGSLSLALLSLAALGVYGRTRALERRAERFRTLSMHIQYAREEERKTAARDVHDELGQLLTAAKMDLSWLKGHPPEPKAHAERVEEAIAMVDSAIDSVKRISTRLRPRALDTLSLSEALLWQLEDFRKRSQIACEASIDPAPEGIDEGVATTLFRVLQEVLTNVGRHSDAKTVRVRFSVDTDILLLIVEDDGKGLPSQAAESIESIGILGMRERVKHEGGRFDIESPSDLAGRGGTRVRVSVPLRKPSNTDKGELYA